MVLYFKWIDRIKWDGQLKSGTLGKNGEHEHATEQYTVKANKVKYDFIGGGVGKVHYISCKSYN